MQPRPRSVLSNAGSVERTSSPLLPNAVPTPAEWPKRSGGGREKGLNAWHDVLELCKKGFAHKMSTLADEILHEVRSEVQQAVTTIRQEVSEIVQSRESNSSKLNQIFEAVRSLEHHSINRPQAVDLSPVLQKLHENEVAQRLANEVMEQRLQEIGRVSDQINSSGTNMADVLQRLEDQVKLLEYRAETAEHKLTEVSMMQQSLTTAANHIAKEVQMVQQLDSKHHSELTVYLQSELPHRIEELKEGGGAADLSDVMEDIYRSRKQNDTDFKIVLSEIARVQQALNLDFVQVINAKVDSVMMATGKKIRDDSEAVETDSDDDVHSVNFTTRHRTGHRMGARKTVTGALHAQTRIRVRDFPCQTDKVEFQQQWTQTDHWQPDQPVKQKKTRNPRKMMVDENEAPLRKQRMGDPDKLREKALEAALQRPYNVFDYYYETGYIQKIAKSSWFENTMMFAVVLNAIWIAIDTDLNSADMLVNADPIFQIAEHTFCFIFSTEIIIRFLAFERKCNCLRDFWFVFDGILVLMAVAETWVLTIVLLLVGARASRSTQALSVLKMVRIVKLVKLSRLARILRAVPELVIIMKGIGYASRSVAVFMFLWLIIIYVFAVAFRQITEGADIGHSYFASVPAAMNTLLLQGIFPDSSEILNEINGAMWYLWPFAIAFFALVSITIMYMLVGVLVDVVAVVSKVEKEGLTVKYVAGQLRGELENLGYNTDIQISKFEFQKIIVEPSITRVLQGVGVDVAVFVDMLDLVFDDLDRKGSSGMSFSELIEVVLSMRGSNPATVKDCKEQVRVLKMVIGDASQEIITRIGKEISKMKLDMQELRDEIRDHDDSMELLDPVDDIEIDA